MNIKHACMGYLSLHGFDDQICFMRKGGRVMITLPPELAFGKAYKHGMPHAGYKDQTIMIDIEIIEWTPIAHDEL